MVEYNPFAHEIIHGDPHPIYAKMRDEAPAYYIERYDSWALSRFSDVWRACTDRNMTSTRGSVTGHLLTKVQPLLRMLNVMDVPDHTRLRSAVRPFFSPHRMRELEADFRRFIVDSLQSLRERDVVDIVADFAEPFATFVACNVSGFPREDGPMLRDLVLRFFKRDPKVEGVTESGIRAMAELDAYFIELCTKRRKSGKRVDDVLGALLAFEMDGQRIPDEEVAQNLSLIVIGGTDTVPKVFGSTLHRLFRNPDVRARVVADRSLALDAFHEALRIDMPTQYMARSLLADTEAYGVKMKAGQPVLLLYASANRDPREFPNPTTYDLDRHPQRFLGFSHGTHACLGIHAARVEARIAVEEFFARFPDYEVIEDGIVRYETEFVQGYSKLPIRLRGH
jgi:cytochrome P450